ncbi:Lacal_2735 family protein [Roseivirga sp.]|uniref:Lacal_2735 family protein n=1 Tax=Roseivirga sp. TaxID=1964215 RepID=UPI003B8C8204
MGWFSRKSEKEKLQDQYKKLVDEAYKLSHSDRKASDLKTAEADALIKRIEAMD